MAIIKSSQKTKKYTVSRFQNLIHERFCVCTQRYSLCVPNAFILNNELDLACVRKSDYLDEFEIKMTYSDFKADFKKTFCKNGELMNKHDGLEDGVYRSNYFYFVFPEGVIPIDEIPENYGVIIGNKFGTLSVVREAKRLHNRKVSIETKFNLAMKLHYRWWNIEDHKRNHNFKCLEETNKKESK